MAYGWRLSAFCLVVAFLCGCMWIGWLQWAFAGNYGDVVWYFFWSGMDQILTDGNHQWMQMASMTMRLLTALGFTMAVRCCRVSDRWESLMGCWQWYWVFCLTGLTSKGGMEGYKPG